MHFELVSTRNSHQCLIDEFVKQHDCKHNQEHYKYLLKAKQDNELLLQRKVFITPTLVRYTVAHEEESNRVLRKFKEFLPYFIRLSFVNEMIEKSFYFGGKNE